ncbi:hypothetical protein BLNAU_15078 [Blattamonas nauphoetae]|uniref:Uncharacterized protein n=1 Tax=Blattamonas nauphoetae TaxID=2049346 RepID=A0ABQ9XFG0_9EUKA|nr:hypothetical protein BLNAU_15078 [Blattamonas nauphoetae]
MIIDSVFVSMKECFSGTTRAELSRMSSYLKHKCCIRNSERSTKAGKGAVESATRHSADSTESTYTKRPAGATRTPTMHKPRNFAAL